MISKDYSNGLPLWNIDIGRPDIFNDEWLLFWKNVHTYIKTCDYMIYVNNAFWFVDSILEDDGRYGGGRMKYMFWFNSEEDLKKFNLYVNTIKGDN